MRTTHHSRSAGFGLLEVVLSAGILATVVGASVGLMNASLRRATSATDRATAMNLAQEGIELVRAARDTTYIDRESNEWTSAFATLSTSEGTLSGAGDSFGLVYQRFDDATCCHWALAKTATLGVQPDVTLSDGVETITLNNQSFRREIYITLPGIDYQVSSGLNIVAPTIEERDVIRKVRVIVRWGTTASEAVESIVYLTDWRQGV